ncbi:MAG: glycosyltransferase family 39 protein [Bryobacteraceae bacterium]|nr:glycosyltransferase family 39 protein [Bryobacteraceae bacterium]
MSVIRPSRATENPTRSPWLLFGGVVVVLFCLAAVYEAFTLGVTVDEPSHFVAGHMYWLGEDVLDPPDTPPVTRLFGGWVARILDLPDPRLSKWWSTRDGYILGKELLDPAKPLSWRAVVLSRLPFVLFAVGAVCLTWFWARRLFSPPVALCVLICVAFEPTFLGHAAFIKSDVPAAFGALWFAYELAGYWSTATCARLVRLALSLAVAVQIKYSLLVLAPLALAAALWRGPRLAAVTLLPAVLYAGILAGGAFRVEPVPEHLVDQFAGAGVPAAMQPAAELIARLPWPQQFVRGLLFVGGALRSGGYEGYMLGRRISGPEPLYFPFAWAIKVPIALQVLTLAGLFVFARRALARLVLPAEVALWGCGGVFIGAAVSSNFHIGFRHLIPALPLLTIGSGFALERLVRSGPALAKGLCVLLSLWVTISSFAVFPNGLSYFNEWIGGPKNGWKYLADSKSIGARTCARPVSS